MAEQQNQIANLTAEEAALDRKKKSLNRIFGALLIIGILLFALLVYEVVMLFI